ncbi:hypothetical protein G5I_06669 [Acromyrmex echinatior]|uniref:Uncharacterized protein n=1 Tax=Acromyrmex echinatior TaxID=103372 RepID=F4WLP3_ACREC|nr:hypothetical protein G5I_06669 [Acromyrmex echinatior]
MSKCCGCIGVCAITEAYQPLKTHTHPRDIVQETFRNGREILRSPRDRRRKPSVRYDVVRTPGSGRFQQNQKRSWVIGLRYNFLLVVVLLKPIAREHERNVGPQTLPARILRAFSGRARKGRHGPGGCADGRVAKGESASSLAGGKRSRDRWLGAEGMRGWKEVEVS